MYQNKTLRRLAEGGLIAAMYAALTLAMPVASYGPIQFRLSEALTILPLFTPAAIPGLAVGCLISNIVGLAMAANVAGAWDILFGSLATLVAAWLTYHLRRVRWWGLPIPATLPPVFINAVVVGLELTLVLFSFSWTTYALNALYVAIGQFVACTVGGSVIYTALTRSGTAKRIFK